MSPDRSISRIGGGELDPPALPSVLIHEVADALLSAADHRTRARVIAQLVREVYESVAVLHPDAPSEELSSLRRVVGEAVAHSERLSLIDQLTPG